jgi:hypothetical protein
VLETNGSVHWKKELWGNFLFNPSEILLFLFLKTMSRICCMVCFQLIFSKLVQNYRHLFPIGGSTCYKSKISNKGRNPWRRFVCFQLNRTDPSIFIFLIIITGYKEINVSRGGRNLRGVFLFNVYVLQKERVHIYLLPCLMCPCK